MYMIHKIMKINEKVNVSLIFIPRIQYRLYFIYSNYSQLRINPLQHVTDLHQWLWKHFGQIKENLFIEECYNWIRFADNIPLCHNVLNKICCRCCSKLLSLKKDPLFLQCLKKSVANVSTGGQGYNFISC